ncbi:MAG: beta-lactamase family protein [Saprospiraceae bacterium]|nr:beta-lactamase family protein [Saprospiraceae bacterium]MBP6567084.1 beta-lactamase family protein [Saprospiraceae bacterium]
MKFRNSLLLLLFPVFLFSQIDSIDIIVKSQMADQNIIGLSLAIVKNGETLIDKGYGLANAEHNVEVQSKTVFRLASISKQFFATAIMKLVQDGKLTLDDDMHTFFQKAPETWKPIQIKHLLSHTSGLVREAPGYDNFKMQSDLSIIKSAYDLPLNFPTGEKYQYCNLGYYMLAEIITQVSGMPWQDYIIKELFVPAGMTNTVMTDFYPVIPNRASGYVFNNGKYINAEAMIAVRPSGGFLSTTTDMIKWDKVLRDKNIILSKKNWELLWTPFIKTSTEADSKSYYGFGWITDEYKGHKLIGHGGSNTGFRTQYSRFVDDKLSIMVLTNTNGANPNMIVNKLADYLLKF